VTVTVKAAKGAGTPAGTVELINNGQTVAGAGADLVLTLSPKGRVAYTFQAGNIGIYAGTHSFSALFISGGTLLGSISKPVLVAVKVPKLKHAVDGLGTATIQNGHGTPIKDGQNATVLYTGFLQGNGEVFDYATADHGTGSPPNLTFTVNADPEQVINGFDRGVRGMKIGETRVIIIPAALGYGPFGSGSSVPANADLVFLVKLQAITSAS
jgi:FKBP-type peptidyl-prolyl cis-trans isomerase FkpA